MTLISDLIMFFRWAKEGWEVHPIIEAEEFRGWL
jgi:hypothetical protein